MKHRDNVFDGQSQSDLSVAESSGAEVMPVLKIVLVFQIFTTVLGANSTDLIRSMVTDGYGRVMEAEPRIVGGEAVDIKTYPFMVSVQWRMGSNHHCGGTYIASRFVMSAAHCMIRYNGITWEPENPRLYLILAGSSNLWYSPTWQVAVTDAVLPHPSYEFNSLANDIGLFRLRRALRITPYVSYAPLPYVRDPDLFENGGPECTVIGWGKTSEFSMPRSKKNRERRGFPHKSSSDTLQHVVVPLMSMEQCKRYFSHGLHHSQVCAGRPEGGVDACQGDSGGPLMLNNTQIAIVSWGHGCAAPHSPGVYCRLDLYMDWIVATTRKNQAYLSRASSAYPWISLINLFLIADL